MRFLLALISVVLISSEVLSQEETIVKQADTTFVLKKYYFCLLKRGPNSNIDSLQLVEIQKGHLAHITRLSKDGKISVAGPFDGDIDWRGIIIFNVNSKEEAEKLQSEDPAVQSGRLIFEIIPWWAVKGSVLK